MTRRRVVAISFLSLAVLTLATALAGKDQAGDAKLDAENKLRAALAERVPVAVRCLEATNAAFEAETATLDQLLEAQRGVKDAKLAVATSQAERIKSLEEWLQRAQKTELNAKRLYEVGTRGGEAMQHAQAWRARLDAEIELYREQLKPE